MLHEDDSLCPAVERDICQGPEAVSSATKRTGRLRYRNEVSRIGDNELSDLSDRQRSKGLLRVDDAWRLVGTDSIEPQRFI